MSIAAFEVDSQRDRLVIVVGLGLVGFEVAKQMRLHSRGVGLSRPVALDWRSSGQVVAALESIMNSRRPDNLDLIWCAGKAGFDASDLQMQAEYDVFQRVLSALVKSVGHKLCVTMISSAGGVYEGSGSVISIDDVSPLRAYGRWKIKQERFLESLPIRHRIYRLSSVYGVGGKMSRQGLIKAMLVSARKNELMTVYTDRHTLRDYVYNSDVAKYLIADTLSNADTGVRVLASGRAVNVDMLIYLIKHVTAKPVRALYVRDNRNNKNIVFSSNVISSNFVATSLEEGVRVVNANLFPATL